MKKISFHYFPRDADAGNLIESLLVSTVASILIIRAFLHLTNYPQLGTGDFHIAHMLLGGFLMLGALIILLAFLNKEAKHIAAVIGGVGFGTFLDELGKFITRDNNYFFQPTIALIYAILVLLFLSARAIEKYFRITKEEYAINALEMTKQVLMHDLDTEEKKRAMEFLKKADQKHPLVRNLKKTFQETGAKPVPKPNIIHRLRSSARNYYLKLIKTSYFTNAVIVFFIGFSIINFSVSAYNFRSIETLSEVGQLASSSLSAILILIGIYLIKKAKRIKAYMTFKYAVLISIFLTQFFLFLEAQLSAITGLFANIVILTVLQYLIRQEETMKP